jgi:hypothetical protein
MSGLKGLIAATLLKLPMKILTRFIFREVSKTIFFHKETIMGVKIRNCALQFFQKTN